MKNTPSKNVRVGPYRLTPAFAGRVARQYGWRVRSNREMPSQVLAELTNADSFSAAVNAKAAHLVNVIGQGAGITDERGLHAAFQRMADAYGLGKLPVPAFPKDEQPKADKQEGTAKPQQQAAKAAKAPRQDEGQDEQDGQQDKADKQQAGEGKDAGKGLQGQSDDDEQTDGKGEGDADGAGDEGTGNAAGSQGDEAGQGDGNGAGQAEQSDEPGEGQANGGTVGNPDEQPDARPDAMDADEAKAALARMIDRQQPLPVQAHALPPAGKWLLNPDMTGGHNPALICYTTRKLDTSASNQLIARLRAELMAVSRHRASRDKDAGDVDFTKLTDIAQRSNLDRVFYTQTHAKRLSAAVQIIIDVSGSMVGMHGPSSDGAGRTAADSHIGNGHGSYIDRPGSKISTAITVAIMLCDALEKLRVPCEVLAFSGECRVVKPWHEKMHSAWEKLARLGLVNDTNLPNAMLAGLRSLAPRREAKHVQAVIIDGDVGCSSQIAPEQMRRKDHKVRTYGFGVGVELPDGVFDRTVSNLSPKNMADAIVTQLKDALLSDR